MQTIAIYIILGAAVLFIGRRLYKAFAHKGGAGCAHCDPADMNKLKKAVPPGK
jgi:hypothetical protein